MQVLAHEAEQFASEAQVELHATQVELQLEHALVQPTHEVHKRQSSTAFPVPITCPNRPINPADFKLFFILVIHIHPPSLKEIINRLNNIV